MDDKIVTIFCLIDDLLKAIGHEDDKRAKISNAEVLTIGYIAVRYFHGNYYNAHQFFMSMKPSYLIDFLTKLKLFITAYSMDCFLKLSDEQQDLLAI